MKKPLAIIVVQQESLRERPRVHKLSNVLSRLGVAVEIWKLGEKPQCEELGIPVRNLIRTSWRRRPPVLRYVSWMLAVFVNWWKRGRGASIFAIGFDSAFPLSILPGSRRWLVFDNLDNISMNYRWPKWITPIVCSLESWTARHARLHVVPSRARWAGNEANLRIVTNTPSKEALAKAQAIARERGYGRKAPLTLYLNGWLSPTRGIRTLLAAVQKLRDRKVPVRVVVAGRPAADECGKLLALDCVEYLGMLTNAEALAVYFRSHLAFTYYDPSVPINRVAESQKWTDCWATGTPFVTNHGIQTLQPYVERGACFTLPYADADALAGLIAELAANPRRLEESQELLQGMTFRYWDEAMELVVRDWLDLGEPRASAA